MLIKKESKFDIEQFFIDNKNKLSLQILQQEDVMPY